MNFAHVEGTERVAVVGDHTGMFTTAIAQALSRKVHLRPGHLVSFHRWLSISSTGNMTRTSITPQLKAARRSCHSSGYTTFVRHLEDTQAEVAATADTNETASHSIAFHHWDFRIAAAPRQNLRRSQYSCNGRGEFHDANWYAATPGQYSIRNNLDTSRDATNAEDLSFDERVALFANSATATPAGTGTATTTPLFTRDAQNSSDSELYDVLFVPDAYGMQAGIFESAALRDQRCYELLRNCIALVKPGGYLVTTTPRFCGGVARLQKCFEAAGTRQFTVYHDTVYTGSLFPVRHNAAVNVPCRAP